MCIMVKRIGKFKEGASCKLPDDLAVNIFRHRLKEIDKGSGTKMIEAPKIPKYVPKNIKYL